MRNNDLIKYAGLAGQILFTLLALIFTGIFIDNKLKTKVLFTIVLSLAGLISILYKVYKDSSKK